MKWLRLGLVLAAAVALVGNGGTALASSGAATPFDATYQIGGLGGGTETWTCSGAHVMNNGQDMKAAGAVSKDSETCLVTGDLTGFAAGTYTGSPAGPLAGSIFGAGTEWQSDYTGLHGAFALSWTITEVDNGNGTFTAEILAFYAT